MKLEKLNFLLFFFLFQVPSEELAHYKLGLMNHPLLMAGLSGQILDSTTIDLLRKDSKTDQENANDQDLQENQDQENQEMGPAAKKSLLQSTFSRGQTGKNGFFYVVNSLEKQMKKLLERFGKNWRHEKD